MNKQTTLHAGSLGVDVAVLQQRLQRAGYIVTVNSHYDAQTSAAVSAYQRDKGLVADGIAGPRTQAALLGIASPKGLSQNDLEKAAASLECDVAAIQAVIEVESPNGGFLPDGRVVILFERHVFWQQLIAAGIEPGSVKAPESILSPQRGGYVGGAAEYSRLVQAAAIHREAAYASCSWGRFQIMGYHAADLGYGTAVDMAQQFATGEPAQLDAFERFLNLSPDMLKALRTCKWAVFAKTYNGPAYADNLYDTKLARAYARHAAPAAVPTDASGAVEDISTAPAEDPA